MPNPNPKQENLQQFAAIDFYSEPLAKAPVSVKLPGSIDKLIKESFATPQDRAAWLRRVIAEAAERELK